MQHLAPCTVSVVEKKRGLAVRPMGDVSWDDLRVDLPLVFLVLERVVFGLFCCAAAAAVAAAALGFGEMPRRPRGCGLNATEHLFPGRQFHPDEKPR